MKKLIFAALLLSAIGASAQQDTLKYRINLTDKAVTDYALDRPEEFLSKKAIERRQKQGAGNRLYRLTGVSEICGRYS